MKNWIKRVVAVSFIVAQFLVIPEVSASSLENIQNKKNAVEEEVSQLQSEVSNRLEEVSEITIALDELNTEIEEHQATINETEEDIVEQEVLVRGRVEYAAGQLQAMQKSEVNQNVVISLLQAESFTELINKIYTVARLTEASEEHIIEAKTEQEKLDDLKEKLLVHQEDLDDKQTKTVEQKEALDTKVAELRTDLNASQSDLEELNAQEQQVVAQAEEARRAREAEKQAAAANTDKKTVTTASNSSSSNNAPASSSSDSSSKQPAPAKKQQPAPQASSAGEWMTFQATGYSTQQPGLSTRTATGIDLRVNPRVIAVDPSVIPLGSLVEIQGLGVYVAGDTGGAINGRIIDIHYSTVGQALSWGRRSVNLRIIN